jgi:two-component system, response regulator PdtaR
VSGPGEAFHLHALVETMVREDRDEAEIVAAVREAVVAAPRILVAEDETLVRLDLRAMLADAGYDVCAEAADGFEAVALAAEHEPDVILMDANMPRLDGVAAARRILATRNVPIVMLTGYAYGELIDRAYDAGIVCYLVKPIGEREVIDALSAVVRAA